MAICFFKSLWKLNAKSMTLISFSWATTAKFMWRFHKVCQKSMKNQCKSMTLNSIALQITAWWPWLFHKIVPKVNGIQNQHKSMLQKKKTIFFQNVLLEVYPFFLFKWQVSFLKVKGKSIKSQQHCIINHSIMTVTFPQNCTKRQ